MSKVVVVNHLTLDGVMQAPGRPDEDRRGGFEHGGWSVPYGDAVMGRVMGEKMATSGALLLGRRTYEDFASYWPKQGDNPYTAVLNASQKYVASTDAGQTAPMEQLHASERRRRHSRRRAQGAAGQGSRGPRKRRARPDADAAQPRRSVPAHDPPARPGLRPSPVHRRRPRPPHSDSSTR